MTNQSIRDLIAKEVAAAEHNLELEALAERVAVIEAENEMLRRQSGWLYRKWHAAEERVKRLETGKVQPPIKHGKAAL